MRSFCTNPAPSKIPFVVLASLFDVDSSISLPHAGRPENTTSLHVSTVLEHRVSGLTHASTYKFNRT